MNFLAKVVKKNVRPFKVWLDQKQPSRGVLKKGVLKIYSKFTREHPCRSAISVKFQSNFSEIALRHGRSPINLLYIFRTPFPKNTSDGLLLLGSLLIIKILSKTAPLISKHSPPSLSLCILYFLFHSARNTFAICPFICNGRLQNFLIPDKK